MNGKTFIKLAEFNIEFGVDEYDDEPLSDNQIDLIIDELIDGGIDYEPIQQLFEDKFAGTNVVVRVF